MLPKRADFLAARDGRSIASLGVVVQIHNRQDQNPPRLGITATRKIGGAVVRTRAKRRLRALGQAVLPGHAKLGHDYVLIARYNTASLPWEKLTDSLVGALAKHKYDET